MAGKHMTESMLTDSSAGGPDAVEPAVMPGTDSRRLLHLLDEVKSLGLHVDVRSL